MTGKRRKNRAARTPTKTETREIPYSRLKRSHGVERAEWLRLGIVLAVALGLRLTYFYLNKNQNPLFDHPVLDALFHYDWAENILSGNFWGNEVFFRAPLYPYLLAMLFKVSGSSVAFAIFVQHVIGTSTVVLVYLLCREYFRPGVALTAAAITALYWPLIYFEGELLIVTLIVALDTLLLWLTAIGLRKGWASKMVIPGLVMGLSAIARPSILIVVPALPFIFRWAARDDGRWKRQTLAGAIGVTLVVAPVILRNAIVGKDFVPIASQAGVNFYIGNNPTSNGTQAEVPGARADLHGTYEGAIELAERDVGHAMKPSEVSNYYFRKGLDYFLLSPGDAFALTLKKTYLFWAAVERSNTKYIEFFWRKFGLGMLPLPGFWFIGPLALCGGVLLWRRRRVMSLLYLFVVAYMIGVVVFFVNARFRLPVVPVLAVFGAYALAHFWFAIRTKSPGLLPAIAVLVVCTGIVNYDLIRFRGVRASDEAISYYTLGNGYLKQGKRRLAQDAFENAARIQEKYPTNAYLQIAGTVDYNLGVLYSENGYTSRAIEAFQRIHPADPAFVSSRFLLAELYVERGEPQGAIRAFSDVLRGNPNDARALIGLGTIYKRAGDRESVDAIVERLRAAHGNDPAVRAQIVELENDS